MTWRALSTRPYLRCVHLLATVTEGVLEVLPAGVLHGVQNVHHSEQLPHVVLNRRARR
jgi:hypothetical protein